MVRNSRHGRKDCGNLIGKSRLLEYLRAYVWAFVSSCYCFFFFLYHFLSNMFFEYRNTLLFVYRKCCEIVQKRIENQSPLISGSMCL